MRIFFVCRIMLLKTFGISQGAEKKLFLIFAQHNNNIAYLFFNFRSYSTTIWSKCSVRRHCRCLVFWRPAQIWEDRDAIQFVFLSIKLHVALDYMHFFIHTQSIYIFCFGWFLYITLIVAFAKISCEPKVASLQLILGDLVLKSCTYVIIIQH